MTVARKRGAEPKRLFNLALTNVERDRLQALADAEEVTASAVIRRWIKQRYEAVFGDAPPRSPR